MNVVIVGAKRAVLMVKQITTSFTPSSDTWGFGNQLDWYSYRRGISAGMAMTEVDYHVRYAPVSSTLFSRFYQGPGGVPFWGDSPVGIRLSSLTEAAVDVVIKKLYVPAAGAYLGTFLTTKDTQVFDALVLAMYLTGKPQILAAQGAAELFHALVVFQARPGQLIITSPNVPGGSGTLSFDGTKFAERSVAQYVGAPLAPVSGYTVLALSSLLPLSTLSANWAAAAAGTIGDNYYPTMPLEYYNYTSKEWESVPAGPTLLIASDTFLVRNNCSNCTRFRSGSPLATRQYLEVYEKDSVTITLPGNAPFTTTTGDTTFSIRLTDIGVCNVKIEVVNAALGLLGIDSTITTTKALQVYIDQSPILRAYPGDVKTLNATVTGFLPPNVRYDWVFGDQGVTRFPTTVPSTTHTWAALGSYTASVALRDPGTNSLLGGTFTNVQIKNWAGAWLITSFIRTGETFTDQFTIPRDSIAWGQMRDTLSKIESGAVPALVFLDDPVLWPEPAVYFEIFPPGNLFLDLYYWQPGGLVTQLARTSAIQFSSYTQTGNTKSGTLNGTGYVTTLNGSFLNSISAVKSQNQLSGTMTIGLHAVNGAHGSRTYQFIATRVSP